MLGNIMIVLVLAATAVVMFIISKYADYDTDYLWGIGGIIIGVIALVWAISIPMCYFEISIETNTFKEQSVYIATHKPKNDIENAALTNKKIELNEWLYQAQWAKEKFGIFSCQTKL